MVDQQTSTLLRLAINHIGYGRASNPGNESQDISLLPDRPRNDLASAEIVFLPYNYLLDPDTRTNTLAEINWSNAIVIFDEAHNLESFASESASFDLSGVDLGGCIGEVQRAISYMQTMPEMAAEIGGGRCVPSIGNLPI